MNFLDKLKSVLNGWDKKGKIQVGVFALVSIVVIGILIYYVGIDKNTENDVEPEIDSTLQLNESEEYTPVQADTVTEDTATLKYVLDTYNKLYGSTEDSENYSESDSQPEILTPSSEEVSSVALISSNSDELNITRYQFAYILYNLIKEANKEPSLENYVYTYQDSGDFPSRYTQAIYILDYTGIFEYDGVFDGYKYVTQQEVDSAVEKLQVYLDSGYLDFMGSQPDNTNEASGNEPGTTTELEQEAIEILSGKEFEDNLTGKSVALYKEPKELWQLETNINNISKVDLYSDDIESAYENSQEVRFEYINLDEGLLDYSLIDELRENHTYQYKLDDTEIVGMTVFEPIGVSKNIGDETLSLTGKVLDDNLLLMLKSNGLVLGINNHKIVSNGMLFSDNGQCFIQLYSKENIDSIGIIVPITDLQNTTNYDELEDGTESSQGIESTQSILAILPLE